MLKNTMKAIGKNVCCPNLNQKFDFISKEFSLKKSFTFSIPLLQIDFHCSPPSNSLFSS